MVAKLHYVYDPLCGWCYAAGPLVEAAWHAGVSVQLHGGGLWRQATRLDPVAIRQIREADARIATVAGVTFGPAYLEELLVEPAATLWSGPPIAAVLAADAIRLGSGLAMLRMIQRAHYVEGRRVADTAVLEDLATGMDLDAKAFVDALPAVPVDLHVTRTRAWMDRHGIHGFPGFLLERDSELVRVQHEPFYGQPRAFLRAVVAASAT